MFFKEGNWTKHSQLCLSLGVTPIKYEWCRSRSTNSSFWQWMQVCGYSHTLQPLYPRGKRPRCPTDRKLGEARSRSWCGGGEENRNPVVQSVASIKAKQYISLIWKLSFSDNSFSYNSIIPADWTRKLYSRGAHSQAYTSSTSIPEPPSQRRPAIMP